MDQKKSQENKAATQGASPNTGEAFESGEPREVGRSHGQIIDDLGTGAGKQSTSTTDQEQPGHNDNTSGQSGKTSQATESGRQRAIP